MYKENNGIEICKIYRWKQVKHEIFARNEYNMVDCEYDEGQFEIWVTNFDANVEYG